jgi:hypothetical protein
MDGYKISHIGLDIDFYHDQSDQIKLPSETKNMYAIDKEQAGIFIETPSVVKYSSEEMLEWHFTHSKKTLAEHLQHTGVVTKSLRGRRSFPPFNSRAERST